MCVCVCVCVQLRREVIALIGACMNAGWLLHTPNDKPPDQLLTDEVSLFLTQVPATSGETVSDGATRTHTHMMLTTCTAWYTESRELL